MNKKDRSKNPLKPKATFKWVSMDIIPATAQFFLTSETTFSNYILFVDTHSKTTKIYGMERITTEKVMDTLDVFQSIFGKIDEFGWWHLEGISTDVGKQFMSMEFWDKCQTRGVWLTLAALDHQEMKGQVEVT